MDKIKAIQILEALASGCSPLTGEVFRGDSVLNDRDVIRALQVAINYLSISLREDISAERNVLTQKKDKQLPPKIKVQEDKLFNNLTNEQIGVLKTKIINLGIEKTEGLSQQIIDARVKHPRAYEPWSDTEIELLKDVIQHTNDFKLLSECFLRNKSSMRSSVQKLLDGTRK